MDGQTLRDRFDLRLQVSANYDSLGDRGSRYVGVKSCKPMIEEAAAALDRERALRKEADEDLELVWTELNLATEELARERARHAADAEALRAVIHHLRPGAAIVRADEPTTGRHRYELFTNLSAQPAGVAAFVAGFRGGAWTDEPRRARDADLPQVGSFHG